MSGEAESSMAPDLFDLLDISLREDSYTSLLKAAMTTTPAVSQDIFQSLAPPGVPLPSHVEVRFRREFPDGDRFKAEGKDRPDLLLVGTFESGAPYWVLIESKIASGEGPGQCARYKELCAAASNAGAISGYRLYYMTLLGRAASASEFTGLSHCELVGRLAPLVVGHGGDAFQLAWRAYQDRLRHLASIEPSADTPLLGWLAEDQWFATRDIRGVKLAQGSLGSGWKTWGGYWIRGAREGHMVQAWQPEWRGHTYRQEAGYRLLDCFNVHLELEIPLGHKAGSLALRLHFETNPYMPARIMKHLPEGEQREFNELRERVRGVVHAALGEQRTPWRRTGHLLQLARAHLNVDASTMVGAFRDAYRVLAEQIAEPVSRTLREAVASQPRHDETQR